MNNPTFDLVAACAFGLEAVVRRELAALGIAATINQSGRVLFQGDRQTICQANLWLRTADRVLIRVAEFPAADFDALFETTKQICWGDLLPPDASFPVTGRAIGSQLSSVPACQRTVKRAIVDALKRDHGTEQLPETGSEYKIDVSLLKDSATLTIDTTGRGLHRRGYRTAGSQAPLKETVAAALVLLSFWKQDRPLLDPFCGTGTIPIEAALIGRNIAPGRNREFAFEAWSGFDIELLQAARELADQLKTESLQQRILGCDIDGRVLRVARENAVRAGVAYDIHFESTTFQQTTSKRRFGCLITHPPDEDQRQPRSASGHPHATGQQEAAAIGALYHSVPEVLRHLPTWSFYFLTGYPGLERIVGREADRRRKLYNGRIECTYYQYHGPRPVVNPQRLTPDADSKDGTAEPDESDIEPEPKPIAEKPYVHAAGAPAFGKLSEKSIHQAELFATRLKKRARHLRRWPTKRGITCYRLYERDIPEIPLVVDRYEDYLHMTEYERPHDRDPAHHANWLDLMAETASKALEIPPQNVFLKRRTRQRGSRQHEKVADTNQRVVVNEGGLKFLVNLADYVDTGLFLDHRITRQMVRQQCSGKSFLNLFAYTGSFTVYAASGGAKRSTTVDLSRHYLDWASDNLRLNNLSGEQHRFVAADIRQFVADHPAGEAYDVVVLDPPTFSNSKRTENDWMVQSDCLPLIADLMPLVRKGGIVYFSTNFRQFKFAANAIAASEIHEISRQTVPEDFRNQRIHRCWRIVR